jgi:hypothetical protein
MNTIFKLEKETDPGLNNTCTISGYVFDRETKEPLIGANIVLGGSKLGTATDIEGFFSIENVPPGKYSLQFSYIGYRSFTKSNIVFEGNYNYSLTVELVFDPPRLTNLIQSFKTFN